MNKQRLLVELLNEVGRVACIVSQSMQSRCETSPIVCITSSFSAAGMHSPFNVVVTKVQIENVAK